MFFTDQARYLSLGALDQRRFPRNRHRLGDGADLQRQIQSRLPPDGQFDAAANQSLESGGFCCDFIVADRKLRGPVAPLLIGSNGPGNARFYVPNRNADTGHNGSGRIGHCPQNRGRGHLRRHLTQPCDQPQQDRPKQSSGHRHKGLL